MARPRTVSDPDILDATARVVSRIGPHRVRLRDVADEVGLAPSTLLQRFGSKRALLVASGRRRAADPVDALVDDGRGNPLKRLEKGLLRALDPPNEPEALAHRLAQVGLELADPELHAEAVGRARERRTAIRALLDRAVDEGRLVAGTRTGRLARSLETTVHGALVTWALHRRKSLKRWVRREIRAVLSPHRPR